MSYGIFKENIITVAACCLSSLLLVLILLVFAAGSSFACDDIDGLIEKRCSLNYSDEENTVRAEIDAKYRGIIISLFEEYERGESTIYDQCGQYYKKDDILYPVIVLMKYYRDRDAKSFVANLTQDKEGLSGMWSLEEIVHLSDDTPLPKKLEDIHLPYTIINEILLLASQGDKGALDFLFSLNADGGYGTNMDGVICSFMYLYPGVVVSNWQILRKYWGRMHLVLDGSCIKSQKPLINTYIALCDIENVDEASRKEILSLFEKRKRDQ